MGSSSTPLRWPGQRAERLAGALVVGVGVEVAEGVDDDPVVEDGLVVGDRGQVHAPRLNRPGAQTFTT
jgi:hypothetical protein